MDCVQIRDKKSREFLVRRCDLFAKICGLNLAKK